jgi:hypothetical protein
MVNRNGAFEHAMSCLLRENPDILNNLLMTENAHFHLSGFVNKQNMRYRSPVNPKELHEMPMHSPNVTVLCRVGAFGIVGPYFFENDNEETVTVNSERYVTVLEGFVEPQLRRLGIDPTALLISRFGDIAWPARSPDLTVPDFFLWGFPCVLEAYHDYTRTQTSHC